MTLSRRLRLFLLAGLSTFGTVAQNEPSIPAAHLLDKASGQYGYMMELLQARSAFPKTYNRHTNRLQTSSSDWWCSGFYPGTLFYLYEATGKKPLYDEGVRMLGLLEKEQFNTETHDTGFMIGCSFGNAWRIDPKPEYKEIIVNAAKSLASRFNPAVGCIKSHNRGADDFVVIIDNMMNLELLFLATQLSGDSAYHHIAVAHANTTMKHHFRPDGSLYHGINYHPRTGEVVHYQAGQGYAEGSVWARGQAWGLYGYTMAYRFTKDKRYLDKAAGIAGFTMQHPNMPDDLIPYWDYEAPDIPHALRDASSAAITCSGLLELSRYVDKESSDRYRGYAEKILSVLSSPAYAAQQHTNGGFLLEHSAGNLPSMTEIDVPLTYADYYYVEALTRYKDYVASYNIVDFGALPDGVSLNTQAIQKAIDKCAEDGGGKVVVPAGVFLTGTIYLRSQVELHLEEQATIKGSPSFEDYPDNDVKYVNSFSYPNGKLFENKALIFGEGVCNVAITGKGTIDGSGDSPTFQLGNDSNTGSRRRPSVILLINSRNIHVYDLHLRNSAYWMQNYLGCDSLHLKGLTIYNHTNYNQDAMDIDAKNVLIEDCVIDADDDGVCLKSHDANRPVENVTVRNCVIASNCNAVKFGTKSDGGFRNVSVSRCVIRKASEDHIRQWQKNLKFNVKEQQFTIKL
jgi:hypothetical protein